MNCVYILYSISIDTFYIGETVDIEKRLEEHNTRYYSTSFTKQVTDWSLYHVIECDSRVQARKIEAHIKRMKSKKYIQNLKKYSEITENLKIKY